MDLKCPKMRNFSVGTAGNAYTKNRDLLLVNKVCFARADLAFDSKFSASLKFQDFPRALPLDVCSPEHLERSIIFKKFRIRIARKDGLFASLKFA